MIYKKIKLLMLFFIFFTSCKDENKKVYSYHENGNVLNEISKISKNKQFVKHYDTNGNLNSKGFVLNGIKNGWWIFYENKKVKTKIDFIEFEKRECINQSIYYDKNGKIIDSISSYFNLEIPDTLNVGKTKINVFYCPKFKKKSQIFYCVGYGINKDFSNINKVQVDTFYIKNPKTGWFGIRFEDTGKKILRGFIYERYFEIQDNIKYKDSSKLILNEHKKFFEREVYIK